MKIDLKEISVSELTAGYVEDKDEDSVVGFGGKLDIRPKYQRAFVYEDKQRDAVIDTLIKGFPLNVMYWAVRENGHYEVIDGQQRTVSICQYVAKQFSFGDRFFHNLEEPEKKKILDYKLMVYFCEGDDKEKLDWFKTINIAGEKLSDQELRNAVYSGSWVTNAKKRFSRRGCPAQGLASQYLTGKVIRQEYLETAIKWKSGNKIPEYMAINQHEPNADELWEYFQSVINWVEVIFPPSNQRKQMKGVEFGTLYNEFGENKYNPKELEKEVSRLMMDDEVTTKKGIYYYVLNGKERELNIRAFDDNQKIEFYERQGKVCMMCKKDCGIEEMEADHIIPWSKGGKTVPDNCQMLCSPCNRAKGGK